MTNVTQRPRSGLRQGPAAGRRAPGTTGTKHRIIVGVDDTPSGAAAMRWAIARVRSEGHPALLVAVRSWALGLPQHGGRHHPHPLYPHVVLYFDGSERRAASIKLALRVLRHANGGLPADIPWAIETPEGDPGPALAGVATHPTDLIVVGRERVPSWRPPHHGTVSAYCSQHAHCPVVVVPTTGAPS